MSTASTVAFEPGIPVADQEAYILRHLSQVRAIARRIHLRLPYQVELDDLIGAGALGLIDAVRRFNPARDVAFSTYAQIRIRGAILDSLRSDDWGPRRLRRLARRLEAVRDQLSLRLGRVPELSELAHEMGLSVPDLERVLVEVRGLQVASFSDRSDEEPLHAPSVDNVPASGPDPFQTLLYRESTSAVVQAVAALRPRERSLIAMYYRRELTMKEIGERLGVSESRVCQMHSSVLTRMRRTLRGLGLKKA